MKIVYISGQISGLERDEYMERFAYAEQLLTEQGYKAVNPTRFFICRHLWAYRIVGYVGALLYDLWRLSKCDIIYKLPGWRSSKGANIESCWAYHMNIYLLPPKQREALDKKVAKHMEKWAKRGIPSPCNVLSRKKPLTEWQTEQSNSSTATAAVGDGTNTMSR